MHTYLESCKLSGQRHLSNEVTEVRLPSLKTDRVFFLSMTSTPHAICFLAWTSLSYWMIPTVKVLCIVGPFSLDSPHIYWRVPKLPPTWTSESTKKNISREKNCHGFHFCVCSLHYFIYLGVISFRNLSGPSQADSFWEVTVFIFKPIWDVSLVNCLETVY